MLVATRIAEDSVLVGIIWKNKLLFVNTVSINSEYDLAAWLHRFSFTEDLFKLELCIFLSDQLLKFYDEFIAICFARIDLCSFAFSSNLFCVQYTVVKLLFFVLFLMRFSLLLLAYGLSMSCVLLNAECAACRFLILCLCG